MSDPDVGTVELTTDSEKEGIGLGFEVDFQCTP